MSASDPKRTSTIMTAIRSTDVAQRLELATLEAYGSSRLPSDCGRARAIGLLRVCRFDLACTTANIASASAGSLAIFTVSNLDTHDGFFASAVTSTAGSSPLAVAFWT